MSGSVTDGSGIGTVEITVVTSLATPVIGAAVSATEEAVVVVLIADLVPAVTEWMIVADLEFTLVCRGITLVVIRTVGAVIQSSTPGDAALSVAVVAVVGVGVGVRHVAETVVHSALLAGPTAAHVRGTAGRMSVRAVGAVITDVSTAWARERKLCLRSEAKSHLRCTARQSRTSRTPGHEEPARCKYRRSSRTQRRSCTRREGHRCRSSPEQGGRSELSKIGIFSYQVAVAPATLVTVVVIATLRILRAAQGAVDGAGPVTDRTHGVLEPHVECESPLPVTEGVCVNLCLTRRALEETGLPCRSTLPEPAAVCKGGGH